MFISLTLSAVNQLFYCFCFFSDPYSVPWSYELKQIAQINEICDVIGLDAEFRQKLLDRDAGYVAHSGVKPFFLEEFSKKLKNLGIEYNTWHQVHWTTHTMARVTCC